MSYELSKITLDELNKVIAPYKNEQGKTPCVALVRQVTDASPSASWARGKRVIDCAVGDVAAGTAIATFLYDEVKKTYYYPQTYPKDGRSMHAAIYVSHDDKQINVIDQWVGVDSVQKRPLRLKRNDMTTARRSNIGEEFYVIE